MNSPEIDDSTQRELLKRHPQLKEKTLIDLVNGFEVVDDHIRVREHRNGFLSRAFDVATGKAARRQQQIDQNHQAGLKAVHEWLQDLQGHQTRSDLAVEIIAGKLVETRTGFMRLQTRMTAEFQANRGEFEALLQQLSVVEAEQGQRLKDHEQRITRLERLDDVNGHIKLVLSKWRVGQYEQFSPLQRLFLACNELQWGDFGDWLRHSRHDEKTERMLEIVRNELIAQLRQDCGGSAQPHPIAFWLTQGQGSAASDREALIPYLAADYPDSAARPLPAVLANPQSVTALNSSQLPRSAGIPKLVRHMLAQTTLSKDSICQKY